MTGKQKRKARVRANHDRLSGEFIAACLRSGFYPSSVHRSRWLNLGKPEKFEARA